MSAAVDARREIAADVAEIATTRKIAAREDVKPSGRQRAYIARLTCELLGLDFPESRRDADALIKRLRAALDGAAERTAATPSDCPF